MSITRREAIKFTLANAALASAVRPHAADAAPDAPEVKTLDIVFEGGGVKGAAFCGALEVLESRGYTYRHLIGTSAGAITAALLAAGYNSAKMQAILTEHDKNGHHVFNSFLLPPDASPNVAPVDPPAELGSLLDRARAKAREAQLAAIRNLPNAAHGLADEITSKTQQTTENTKTHWNRMLSLISSGALASDANFLSWLSDRLGKSPVLEGMSAKDTRALTLGEFDKKTRGKGIQLSVVATDVTGMRSLVLNRHTAPDVPVVDAVRMSMGIPLVWPEVEWRVDWGMYRGKFKMWDKDNAGNRVVDGGVLSNFPLRYLIDPDKYMTEKGVLGIPAQVVTTRLLGLMLDERTDLPGVDPTVEKENMANKLKAFQSLSHVLNAMSGAADQEAIEDATSPEIIKMGLGTESPICRIPVKGYQTLDFDMSPDRMAKLIESGRKSMRDYLPTRA